MSCSLTACRQTQRELGTSSRSAGPRRPSKLHSHFPSLATTLLLARNTFSEVLGLLA